MRLDIHAYHIMIAFAAAARGTCPRRRVGAVLTKDGKITSSGYNGSPPHLPHCDEVGCMMHEGFCIRTIHAEMNALLRGEGDTLYCTDQPCLNCLKAAVTRGVVKVYYVREYPDRARDEFVHRHGMGAMLRKLPMPNFQVFADLMEEKVVCGR